jgi:sucrose-6-phosphate hydrolase SacC (GH32 family)
LIQQPLESITQLRKEELKTLENITEPIELEVELQKSDGGIKLQTTDGDELMIGYDATSHQLFIDRSKAGLIDFQKDFGSIEKAMVTSENTITVQVFIDHSIVEVFANGGEITFGEQFFFKSKSFNIKTFGKATIKNSWLLKSIWK